MNIIIVDSVKGGCGKTTVALKQAIEKCSMKRKKVCVIDFDFLGSSLGAFMFGENKNYNEPYFREESEEGVDKEVGVSTREQLGIRFKLNSNNKAKRYLNDFFLTNNILYKDYINKVDIYEHDKKSSYFFDLIMSSPVQKDKNMFKATAETHYIEKIDYGHFRSMVVELIRQLYEANYHYVIFDMPPNSDSYTDVLFEIVYRNKKDKLMNFDYKVELLLVSSFDYAHFKANMEWLRNEYIYRDWKNKFFDDYELKLIFNNTTNYDGLRKPEHITISEFLQQRIIIANKELTGILSVKSVFYYDYDEEAAYNSTTPDRGILFGETKMGEEHEV